MGRSKDIPEELSGFAELLEGPEFSRWKNKKSKEATPTFEFMSFLQRENKRLERLIQLLTETSLNLEQTDQQATLEYLLKQEIESLEKDLMKSFDSPESAVFKNMDELLQNHFRIMGPPTN